MTLEAAEGMAPAVVAGGEAPGRRGLVVLGLEVAGTTSCQWSTVAATEVVIWMEVAGVEAIGCKTEVQLLKAAGKGSHHREKGKCLHGMLDEREQKVAATEVPMVESAATGCRRQQHSQHSQ